MESTSELAAHLIDNEFNHMYDGTNIDGKIYFLADETFVLNSIKGTW